MIFGKEALNDTSEWSWDLFWAQPSGQQMQPKAVSPGCHIIIYCSYMLSFLFRSIPVLAEKKISTFLPRIYTLDNLNYKSYSRYFYLGYSAQWGLNEFKLRDSLASDSQAHTHYLNYFRTRGRTQIGVITPVILKAKLVVVVGFFR